MPSIFIDDGTPEAAESTSSYICYDEDDLESMRAALDYIRREGLPTSGSQLAAEQFLLETIDRKKAEWTGARKRRPAGPLRRLFELLRSPRRLLLFSGPSKEWS